MKTSRLAISLVCLSLFISAPAFAGNEKKPDGPKPIGTLEDLPRDAKLALFEAQTLLEKGEAEKAVAQLGKYVRNHEKKDDHFLVRYQYASMLVQIDRREDALKEYQRVVQLEPRYDAGWMGLGETAYGLGQFGPAADALMKGYELSAERRPELLYYAAVARLQAGEPARALPVLDDLTSGKHGQPKFEWFRGFVSACLQAGDKERGARGVSAMTDLYANNADAWYLAFQYHSSASDYRQAAVSLTVVSYLRPLTRDEQMQLGSLYAAVDAPAAAAKYYSAATADSAKAEEIERVASAFLASFQPDAALEVLDKGLRTMPTYKLWSLLGDLQVMEKRFEEAYRAFTECTKLDPEQPRPHLMLGYCAIEMNDPAQALTHLRKIAANEEYADRVNMLIQRAEIMQAAPSPEPSDSSESHSGSTSLSGK